MASQDSHSPFTFHFSPFPSALAQGLSLSNGTIHPQRSGVSFLTNKAQVQTIGAECSI